MPGEDCRQFDAAGAACQQFDQHLAAYLEGEDGPEVLAHAQQCPYCGTLLADMEQIRFASRHLPLEEPPARVWANIRAALQAGGILREQIPAWYRWFPRLAFLPRPVPLGALACLALLGLTLLISPGGFEPNATLDVPSPAGTVTAAGVISTGLDEAMTRTLRDMENAYLSRENFLEPAVKTVYRRSLESLDASIQESLTYCQREPSNRLAREYLVNAYKSKADVLASALELGGR